MSTKSPPPPRRYRAPGTTQLLRTPRRRSVATSPLLKATLASQREGKVVDTTTIGAAAPQDVDEFGAEAGVDLTQVGPTLQEFDVARRGLHTLTGVPITRRPGNIGDVSTLAQDDTTLPALDASSIPGTPPLSQSVFGTFGDFTLEGAPPPGQLDYGLRTPQGVESPVELDSRDLPQSAESINLSAAFDAVGSADAGNLAARGGDRDPIPHMDDYSNALQEITQLLQTLVSRPYNVEGVHMPDAQPEEFDTGLVQMTRGTRPDGRRGAIGTVAPSNVVGDLETDSEEETADAADPSGNRTEDEDSDDEALQLAEELNQPGGQPGGQPPVSAPVQTGAVATAVTRQLDLEARAEAAEALRRAPGIMKLIEARIFKFDDFLTNGNLDARKLQKVSRVLAKRVDSTAESYALAARAKGYAPSGAAYPVDGLNNIVAGVRKIPGSKYVIYQGPQYVNG